MSQKIVTLNGLTRLEWWVLPGPAEGGAGLTQPFGRPSFLPVMWLSGQQIQVGGNYNVRRLTVRLGRLADQFRSVALAQTKDLGTLASRRSWTRHSQLHGSSRWRMEQE